jgi:hypothetical protein
VVDAIASAGSEPRGVGRPFRGRADIVKRTVEQFQITEPEAGDIIDLAILDLHEGNDEADKRVRRRLMLRRLSMYRELILDNVKNTSIEMAYEWVSKKDENDKPILDEEGRHIRIKRLKRELHTSGFDAASMKLLLEIEQLEAQLQKLDAEEDGVDAVAQMMAILEQHGDGTTKQTTHLSLSQKLKRSDVHKMTGKAGEIVRRALSAASAPAASAEQPQPDIVEGVVISAGEGEA